jgi:hypothetical protein
MVFVLWPSPENGIGCPYPYPNPPVPAGMGRVQVHLKLNGWVWMDADIYYTMARGPPAASRPQRS